MVGIIIIRMYVQVAAVRYVFGAIESPDMQRTRTHSLVVVQYYYCKIGYGVGVIRCCFCTGSS